MAYYFWIHLIQEAPRFFSGIFKVYSLSPNKQSIIALLNEKWFSIWLNGNRSLQHNVQIQLTMVFTCAVNSSPDKGTHIGQSALDECLRMLPLHLLYLKPWKRECYIRRLNAHHHKIIHREITNNLELFYIINNICIYKIYKSWDYFMPNKWFTSLNNMHFFYSKSPWGRGNIFKSIIFNSFCRIVARAVIANFRRWMPKCPTN